MSSRSVTNCLLLHILDKVENCHCAHHQPSNPNSKQAPEFHINYINQEGNANISGKGEITFKHNPSQINEDLEQLRTENKLLKELLQILQNRDK